MRSPVTACIIILLMLVLGIYFSQGLRSATFNFSSRGKSIIQIFFWSVVSISILSMLLFVFTDEQLLGRKYRSYLFTITIALFFSLLVGSAFLLADDLRRLIQWLAGKLFFQRSEAGQMMDAPISRSQFLSWAGVAVGSTLFGSFLYGFSNKYRYHLNKVQLSFPNLPAAFRGLKIIQISDIHSGSLTEIAEVEKGIEKIMAQKPDLILFTGDLVNNEASEMNELKSHFSKLNAPLGVYSILGNHDYGEYIAWPSKGITKAQNLERLKAVHKEMGWILLLNQHVVLKKEGAEIALLGIENWSSKARFPKYGKLDEAYKGCEQAPFKILMSHDPSHWEAQVSKDYKDIDLTLSGHTHGMQFGVELPGFKWSPVQYVYKFWAGLYEQENQKLYVNRGFGFIGYPGRVGILPEITLIELS